MRCGTVCERCGGTVYEGCGGIVGAEGRWVVEKETGLGGLGRVKDRLLWVVGGLVT